MASGKTFEPKTSVSYVKQPNGDIYVIERTRLYDPEIKRERVLSSKLLGKIPKGGSEMIPTRPLAANRRHKRELHGNDSLNAAALEAAEVNQNGSSKPDVPYIDSHEEKETITIRAHTDMLDILEFIGRTSGIDQAVYEAVMDEAAAQKVITLARYLFAQGAPLLGIVTWQLNRILPCWEGFSEETCRSLFLQVGRKETIQNFFFERAKGLLDPSCIALDATAYAYAQGQPHLGIREEEEDALKAERLFIYYSLETKQPVAYLKNPGRLFEVSSFVSALEQLEMVGFWTEEMVFDSGFYSEKNAADLLDRYLHFIMPVNHSLKWVRKAIDDNREKLLGISCACRENPGLHGITVEVRRDFRRYTVKNDLPVIERFNRIVLLHIFYDSARENEERVRFENHLIYIKEKLEEGKLLKELSESEQEKAKKYLLITKDNRGMIRSVDFNLEECEAAKLYMGFFVLLADQEKDAFRALEKYLSREPVKDFFQEEKEILNGKRLPVWTRETKQGRLFVQFVALCYQDYYMEKVAEMKKTLGRPTGDPGHDSKENLGAEQKLLRWLNSFSVRQQLAWFDALDIDTEEVKTGADARRWSAESVRRDQLFLRKLGMTNVH